MTTRAQDSLPTAAWHTRTADETLAHLQTSAGGLSSSQVSARQQQYGPNAIAAAGGSTVWALVLHQFTSPLIAVLLLVMVVTAGLQHWADTIVIGAVVLLNAVVGFTQEYRAEHAMQALMQMLAARATVLRDGRREVVDSRTLVPGDLVFLESGDLVPADVRLVQTTHLEVDEALLTGESLPVAKVVEALPGGQRIALGDQRNMAFMGTAVTAGRGLGVVVATGLRTQMGSIAGEMRGMARAATPLQTRMLQFGRWISVAILSASTIVFVIGVRSGLSWVEMFLTAVAIAVAAIPEGLPIAMTVALAVGVNRMARRNAIIRRLVAVETLGSCTVIVTDKTGTLTENQMTVQAIWTPAAQYAVSGPGRSLEGTIMQNAHQVQPWEGSALYYTLLGGVLDNEAVINVVERALIAYGDPTEVALLVAGAKAGLHREPLLRRYVRVDHIPFEPFRRFSASLYHSGSQESGFVKGAPERVLQMCDVWLTSAGLQPLDQQAIMQAAEQMAHQGLRVLAFAVATSEAALAAMRNGTPQHLTFVGLQGMMDPPRAEVIPAIAACKRAGIRIIMATGDHAATATAVAHRIGLSDSVPEVRTGPQLEALSAEAFAATLRTVSVFSRVSPTQKLQIVTTLREQGHVVAVTGDGVNDAPALKAAHIGAAMGRSGTDVAREASDMVLADDNFATIYNAVEEGRTAFANIRKVTFFLLSSGVGQLLTLLASLLLRLPLPLLPTQILWMNMVTNGIQDVALAFEPGEDHFSRRPPRSPGEGMLSRVLLERIMIVGLVMAAGALLMFQVEMSRGATLSYAQVTALTTLVMFQIFHVGNCRSEEVSVLRRPPFANPILLFGTLAALAVHIAAMHVAPTQHLIRLEPLAFDTWVRLCAVALSIVLVVELHKLLRRPTDVAF